MEQFILDKTQPALALDALASSHPISVTVHDPSEIEAIFDTISYSKVNELIEKSWKLWKLSSIVLGCLYSTYVRQIFTTRNFTKWS